MDHKYTALVDTVYSVEYGRRTALRRAVFNMRELYDEFRIFYPCREFSNEIVEKIQEFVRMKGLRIVAEKPVVRIKDDRYTVDVYYEITW